MKKIVAMILALTFALGFAGCSTSSAGNQSTGGNSPASGTSQPSSGGSQSASAAKKMTFGVAMPQLDNDGFKANLVGIKQFAEENNIELVVTDAKATADMQMQQMEDLITKKVDAIVMCPVDSGALGAVVSKAKTAGIPVVAFDRNVSGNALTGLAESDNVAHGAAGADLMKEVTENAGMKVSDLAVLELLGTQSATAGLERHQGFSNRAKELGIKIVSALPTDFKNDTAYNAVLDAFQANPHINAIFVSSDNALYSGVESALQQIGKLVPSGQKGHIIITTVDGGPQGLKGIRNKYIDATAAQSKLVMSNEAMKMALAAAKGETIAQNKVEIQPTTVTLKNVDDPTLWANSIKQ